MFIKSFLSFTYNRRAFHRTFADTAGRLRRLACKAYASCRLVKNSGNKNFYVKTSAKVKSSSKETQSFCSPSKFYVLRPARRKSKSINKTYIVNFDTWNEAQIDCVCLITVRLEKFDAFRRIGPVVTAKRLCQIKSIWRALQIENRKASSSSC